MGLYIEIIDYEIHVKRVNGFVNDRWWKIGIEYITHIFRMIYVDILEFYYSVAFASKYLTKSKVYV